MCFTSHIVQIKQSLRSLSLTKILDFTSHIVQIKQEKIPIPLPAQTHFTSHIVQIKLVKEILKASYEKRLYIPHSSDKTVIAIVKPQVVLRPLHPT